MQWQSRVRAFCGLICASLAACSVGTPYRRPEIPLPQQWNAPDSQPAVWPDSDWWHGFGSARLNELITQAQQSNDDLAGAIARVQEADAQLRIAGAPLLPSVDLGATATVVFAQAPGGQREL
jgi:multidrug efflux system outer membrane protein